MKTILILSMILAASASHALECTDIARIDAGYAITVDEANSTATVYKLSKKDRAIVATLQCVDPKFGKPTDGSQTYITLICSEPLMADAGYAVFLKTASSSADVSAILSEVTIAGSAKIADLFCE